MATPIITVILLKLTSISADTGMAPTNLILAFSQISEIPLNNNSSTVAMGTVNQWFNVAPTIKVHWGQIERLWW